MALLKKVKSATLIETLIATVLIVVVFLIASMVINTLFFNTFHHRKEIAEARLNELEYSYLNKAIQMPYEEEIQNWDIIITEEKEPKPYILLIATNKITKKELRRTIFVNEY